MTQTYKTSQGDVLDEIAWRYYGACDSSVLNTVLAANPGLADKGPVFPANIAVSLPDIAQPSTTQQAVSLWD